MSGYCVKCRENVAIKHARKEFLGNGRPVSRGKCSNDCGTTVMRFLEGKSAPPSAEYLAKRAEKARKQQRDQKKKEPKHQHPKKGLH